MKYKVKTAVNVTYVAFLGVCVIILWAILKLVTSGPAFDKL